MHGRYGVPRDVWRAAGEGRRMSAVGRDLLEPYARDSAPASRSPTPGGHRLGRRRSATTNQRSLRMTLGFEGGGSTSRNRGMRPPTGLAGPSRSTIADGVSNADPLPDGLLRRLRLLGFRRPVRRFVAHVTPPVRKHSTADDSAARRDEDDRAVVDAPLRDYGVRQPIQIDASDYRSFREATRQCPCGLTSCHRSM